MSDDTLVVRSAVAPLNGEPRAGSEQTSQALAGHVVLPLEERDAWRCVRLRDGYEGWMHRGYLRAVPAAEREVRWREGRVSLGCTVLERDGTRRALPLGAVLSDDAIVEQGTALDPRAIASRFPRDATAIARTALELFEGTPYEWGGITPWGADCSGLVQTVFGLHGIPLPRDARQQAEHGADVGLDLGALRPADLLFFSDRPDGRITHVAIGVRPRRLVHLAIGRGGYSVEELGGNGDEYVTALRDRLRAVRRVLPY